MIKTIGRFVYSPLPKTRKCTTIAASKSEDIHHKMKKSEITRVALQQMYESPSLHEPEKLTTRQMRLKMILHEALDIAHSICEHNDANAEECLWAWEMVDEIDDAATRAGVKYQ